MAGWEEVAGMVTAGWEELAEGEADWSRAWRFADIMLGNYMILPSIYSVN